MVTLPCKLKASQGWFDNFKKRPGIHSIVRHGEAASSDVKAAEEFVKRLVELVEAKVKFSNAASSV